MFSYDYHLPDLKKLEQVRLKPMHTKDQLEIMIVESYNNIVRHSIMKRIHDRGALAGAVQGKMHEQMGMQAKAQLKLAEDTLKELLDFHKEEVERLAAIPKEPLDEPTKGGKIEP